MVVVNFKLVMGASQAGPPWLVDLAGLLEGRAAATFVVLAGAGISLLSKKAREFGDVEGLVRDRTTLLKRALFLFVVGLLYTPIWPPDILHFYGLYISVAALLLAASTRRLAGLALGLPILFMVMLFTLDYEREWNWETLAYSDFWTPAGMVRHLFFNGFHPVVPWLSFLLVGMLLGRMNILDRAVRRRIFVAGTGMTLAAEVSSGLLIRVLQAAANPREQADIAAILGTEMMPPAPLYMLAGSGVACAVIAACVEIGIRGEKAAWLRPLLATGELALTLYVAHVVVGMGILGALGRLEDQSLSFALGSAAAFCGAAVLFSTLWRSRFKRGPLEAILRKLTDPA